MLEGVRPILGIDTDTIWNLRHASQGIIIHNSLESMLRRKRTNLKI